MGHAAPDADEFVGFNEARRIMWCHEVRSRTFTRMTETTFIANPRVSSVHVDNTARTDRIFLSAFDHDGVQVGSEILFVDDPTQQIDITPEFDHDFTQLVVRPGSQLADAVNQCNGWVINMEALRAYDLELDRRTTQREVFMAHLPDLMSAGQVREFSIGKSSE